MRACAPTGIAAANIELEGTPIAASTVHSFFDFNTSYQSNLDLGQTTNAKVDCLLNLEVLLLDEVSMLDTDFWHAMITLFDI